MKYKQRALKKHKDLKGKISINVKDDLNDPVNLSLYYTPGVGAVSKYISDNPDSASDYTWLGNNVAIISDGSSVLGLGDIGPTAALPVMEGKAMLFKHFADIDAIPVVIDSHSADEIVATVKSIAPSFGGINLEDIAAPICFEVEERLKNELRIPVMHDDQHGTAVVVLAGLINACKVSGKDINDCLIVVNGVGAAGVAIMRLLRRFAPGLTIIAVDSHGIIHKNRNDLNPTKQRLIDHSIILANESGSLGKALKGADIFIGVSRGNILSEKDVKRMNKNPIIFAMANPEPEILPELAKKAGAGVVATGRSDFPNQVNNALAFPGIFRGALDNKVKRITTNHKIEAAKVIAELVENPTPENIIPSIYDKRLVPEIAKIIV
ncbi:NADP-dependent malic enzyme [Candidatus Saccharibacteria bacterium]|nr:NADP-dependent malic enzyme [Candidatus Saccharibacteria bacterium]